jgi:hypothetical protein
MGFFRKDKPIHEELAEEAEGEGLEVGYEPKPPNAFSGFLHDAQTDAVGITGVARPREWDAVTSVEAELPGDVVHFVALEDGSLVVDEDVPDGSLTPFAEAVEATLSAPYRAEAVRQGDTLWTVGARSIRVASYPNHRGDELELVEEGRAVIGRRIDGDLFEVEVAEL